MVKKSTNKSKREPIDDRVVKLFATPDLKKFIENGYFNGSGLIDAIVDEYKTRKDKKKK